MKKITFAFKDKLSNYKWRTQSCEVESVEECIHIYGLDKPDIVYEILEEKEI